MAQDSDVARMAAALRTPSLRYRSFGNTPVRSPAPRDEVQAADDFPLLDEALAAIENLPANLPAMAAPPAILATPGPPWPVPSRGASGRPAAPVPGAAGVEALTAASAQAGPVAALPPLPVPVVPPSRPPAPVAGARGAPSLLRTLLAEAPAASPRAPVVPIVVGRQALAASAPPTRPAAAEPEPLLPSALAAAAPGGVAAPAPPPFPDPWETRSGRRGRAPGAGSGSSLLDALVGQGEAAQSAAHYPLLDALTAAMRSDPAGASSRLWPAAQVETALPELLRRIAAGVRSGRSLV